MKTAELINKGKTQASYVSPRMKVIEVAAQRVVCQSGDIEGFTVLEDDTDNW